ncbi:MAG: hypothetical protein R3C19_02410 [Planctomycetaceae bacterium]
MKRVYVTGIVAVLLSASTGCAVFESGRDAMSQTMRMFRPRPFDEPADVDDQPDEWGFVGDEGRAELPRERDPDRWWQNLVMSEDARNIERNLGID